MSGEARFPVSSGVRHGDRVRLLAMMGLNFLVLVSIGILRPVKNSFALDGLAEGDFYQVYLISALVMFFAPLFNRLADWMPWRTLIPGTAAFFAVNLLLFRALYVEGSTTYGMILYGWYDLFAAALVTQFFMAVQVFFNARDAKAAIPLVVAAGSLGAVLGGGINAFFARAVGTPNLLLVAAACVGAFALALPFIWSGYPPVAPPRARTGQRRSEPIVEELSTVFSHPHIRLIAGLVLITVLVKQIVDYEFLEAVSVFLDGERDAMTSFQGAVYAVKDILPVLVLIPLGPLLKRFGVGFAVLMLPVFMLGSTLAIAVAFSVWTTTVAKAGDSMFRYSAERTAREILYVPVPTRLKLKAKAYVDAALEKGFGKAAAGILIGVCAAFMDYRDVIWVAAALSLVWCYMAWGAKREYVAALADSIRGRFATLDAGFASLTERSVLAMVEDALRSDDPVQVGFALDLVEQAGRVDAKHLADELDLLLGHADSDVRVRVLRLLARFPGLVDEGRIRDVLREEKGEVAEAAMGALAALSEDEAGVESTMDALLHAPEATVRRAALSWLLSERAGTEMAERLGMRHIRAIVPEGAVSDPGRAFSSASADVRREVALASGLVDTGTLGSAILAELLADPDVEVRVSAIRSAAHSGSAELAGRLLPMLADPATRAWVKDELVHGGSTVGALCRERLADPGESAVVRGRLAEVLAHVPEQESVSALQSVVADQETPFGLRFGSLKALNKLRLSSNGALAFDRASVLETVHTMVDEANEYLGLSAALERPERLEGARGHGMALLGGAAREAWADRREVVFRLLGLVFPPNEVYRCHGTLEGADERSYANALEWLERTLGHELFTHVLPVLDGRPDRPAPPPPGGSAPVDRLAADPDPWIAAVAAGVRNGPSPGDQSMDVIAKAFLLRKVDLLEGARSAHLGLLASIAEEIEADSGEVLVRAGEPSDALYVIVRGSAELSGVGGQTLTASEGTAFGTWSLIDSAPSVVSARTLEPTRLLRITRDDFQELLRDHPELAASMLQALARRLRSLVA